MGAFIGVFLALLWHFGIEAPAIFVLTIFVFITGGEVEAILNPYHRKSPPPKPPKI